MKHHMTRNATYGKIRGLVAVLALCGGVLAATPAAAKNYVFDPVHTQILFSVEHLGFSFSHGAFTVFSGGFSFDPAAVEKSKVDVTIQSASVDLNDDKWNAHLKNADFLDVEQHPTIVFKSTSVEKTGDNTGKLHGDLTILAETKPVTLDVTWNKSGVHPYSKQFVAGFSATGTVKRSDFGMTYGLPGIGDDVKLVIQVEGVQQDFESP